MGDFETQTYTAGIPLTPAEADKIREAWVSYMRDRPFIPFLDPVDDVAPDAGQYVV